MVTKYDVGDEVYIKAKVHKITAVKTGKINYVLDIPNCISLITFEEKDIAGKLVELGMEWEKQVKAETIDEVIKKLAESEDTILSDKQYHILSELKE